MRILDRICLVLTVLGALSFGSYGAFRFDFLGWLCGGSETILARIVYSIIGISAIWTASLLFRSRSALTGYSANRD
jgi:uncharacterized membrane protein YuzA (DUF378 family)